MEQPSSVPRILNFRINKSIPEYLVQYANIQPIWLSYQKLGNKQIIATYNRINNVPSSLFPTEELSEKAPAKEEIKEANDNKANCNPTKETKTNCILKKKTQLQQEYYPLLKNDVLNMKIIYVE